MFNKLLGMLKPHVPDVEKCNLLVAKLVDLIEEDRELEVETAHNEGYDEGHDEGYDEGYDKGYDKGYEEGYDEDNAQ